MANAMLRIINTERYINQIKGYIKPFFDFAEWFILVDSEYKEPGEIPSTEMIISKYNEWFLIAYEKLKPYVQFTVSYIQRIFGISTVETSVHPTEEKDPIQLYIEKQKAKWLELYTDSVDNCIVNRNIPSLFYEKKEFLEYMKMEHTDLEKEWKTRILLENTPRGNIIMYYDAYKQGFAYYADQFVSYPILNAVAMKYVALYGCRDFFLDNQYTDKESPFIDIYEKPEKPVAKSDTSDTPKMDTNNKVFAKLKNYNSVSSKVQPNPVKEKSEPIPSDKIIWKNRFVCCGKMANYRILQTIKKAIQKEIPLGEGFDKHDAEIAEQGKLTKEFMNYRQFKEMAKQVTKPVTE